MTNLDQSFGPGDSHLDKTGEALLYEELQSFWHPVAYASDLVEGGPIPALS